MKSLKNLLQSGDWKGEKHVPVIHAPEKVKLNESFDLKVSIGDEIKHPNTFEHHISWIKVFFHPEGEKFPIELASFNFSSHGESSIFTEPVGLSNVVLSKSGTIYALSYCNIHGLWENSKDIVVE
ncbi:superoxide reductase [Alkalithermobacter thermoalcaliphilus JW-YL-7 = DSM 7308]|uniref:Desulfoferrodoxin ferrous iron-binding region n=1 Tax=Alkalithermobacter thermoalcaliphilus JW-YL-7 = DSM 7308 TaxID=1121328 RepID=A0A150FPY6_CLOPD|nr:Desulfoferrodoxin ferrous iron-binding region [[Clostridium] paradoxum JW-YL-7 = DSM 7308]SHK64945.1 superoxide reductase [[Clostridium] paradoxum JW-YL-7 = DSM 7308]